MRRTIPAEGNGTSFILALRHEKALLFLQTASLGPLPSRRVISFFLKTLAGISIPTFASGLYGEGDSRRLTI